MTVQRLKSNRWMSQAVAHGDTVYVAGQVAQETAGKSVTEQTREILKRIDSLLGETGTDKTRLLSAQVWLSDINSFDEMNAVWEAWLPEGCAPARTCIEARLAAATLTVEIMVIAAR